MSGREVDDPLAARRRGGSFRVEPLAVGDAQAAAREAGINEAMAPLSVYRVLLRQRVAIARTPQARGQAEPSSLGARSA